VGGRHVTDWNEECYYCYLMNCIRCICKQGEGFRTLSVEPEVQSDIIIKQNNNSYIYVPKKREAKTLQTSILLETINESYEFKLFVAAII